MSDTPRTDAAVVDLSEDCEHPCYWVSDEFARRLERDLNTLQACGRLDARLIAEKDARAAELASLVERAEQMMIAAGYGVVAHDADHNNPIIAWLADVRAAMRGPRVVGPGLIEGCAYCGNLRCECAPGARPRGPCPECTSYAECELECLRDKRASLTNKPLSGN